MIYGVYQSAAGMLVNEYRQGVIANNLANAESPGFKRDVSVFQERAIAADAGVRHGQSHRLLEQMTGGIWLGQTRTDFRPGPFTRTDTPTDLALEGPGFLLVEKGGQTLATREGRLMVDRRGAVVAAADGAQVLAVGGQPLRVDPTGGEVRFDEFGRVYQRNQVVGQLAIVDFANYDALQKVEGQRFAFDAARTTDSPARVLQGVLEGSGAAPIQELVSMMEASRAYQLNASMLSLQDQSIGRLISTVAA